MPYTGKFQVFEDIIVNIEILSAAMVLSIRSRMEALEWDRLHLKLDALFSKNSSTSKTGLVWS